MAVLRWRHGKSASEARDLMQKELNTAGYSDRVKWSRDEFSASVGPFGAGLSIKGKITDQEAVLDKCGGIFGGQALKQIREILTRLFPGGEGV